MTAKSALMIRRHVLDRVPEITVPTQGSDHWEPFHAEPLGVNQIVLWAIEETKPLKQVNHVLLLVGGLGGMCELPSGASWNGHIATWTEEPYTWHLFRSYHSPKRGDDPPQRGDAK